MSNVFRPWLENTCASDVTEEQDDLPSCSRDKTPVKNKGSVIGYGAKLRGQTVKIVQNVRKFFRCVLQANGALPNKDINKLTEAATGVSLSTVKKISKIEDAANYRTPTKKKENKTKMQFDKIDDFTRDLLRRTAYEFYTKGEAPTTEKLVASMREKTAGTDFEFPYGGRTVNRLLITMGFRYKTVMRKSTRAESQEIIAWRYRYLDQIKRFRLQGYCDVYLDETWYDSNTCKMKNWSDDSENCAVRQSDRKGERIVIMHCGGRFGFIDGALFITHKSMDDVPADYHGTMNSVLFEDWFENSVLRRLEEPSVIVCDNASYHSRVVDPRPNLSWKKDDILAYMRRHRIEVPDPVPIKPVLLQVIHEQAGPRHKRYAIDELAASYGHMVLRLPPHHCIFNPIEQVWSEVKRRVSSYNLRARPLGELINILQNSVANVTPEKWNNYIRHVEEIEASYRNLQSVFDTSEQLVIAIEGSSSEDEESDDDLDTM